MVFALPGEAQSSLEMASQAAWAHERYPNVCQPEKQRVMQLKTVCNLNVKTVSEWILPGDSPGSYGQWTLVSRSIEV